MAMSIGPDCTGCGDCLELCPNDAIGPALPVYRINVWLCTECLGFAEDPQCAAACPAAAIVPASSLLRAV